MEGDTPIRTLGDYSRPSHEGYRNTIELPDENDVAHLRSDTIRLVQDGCSFHGLRSEDSNQHLKDFLKLVDPLDLNGATMKRTRLRLFQFSLRDQASNWIERLPAGSNFTSNDLTTRFLSQFFSPRRTAKLCNDILMFQQHQGESLSEAWHRFKDLLQKFLHHDIDRWLQIQIFYDHVTPATRRTIDHSSGGKLSDKNADESWAILEDLALYDNEIRNDPREDVYGDKGLQVIGKYCKKLRKLSYNGLVTHLGLIALAKGCTKLGCLKVRLEDFSNEAIKCLGTHMKYLRKFRIHFDKKDGTTYLPLDNGVRATILGCNKLERLEISLWHGGLTDVGLEYIGKYGRNLRFLSLTRIGKSDAGLVKLLEGCPKLRKLKLMDCPFSKQVVTSFIFLL